MTQERSGEGECHLANTEDLDRFRQVQTLHNHWARSGGARAFYWYLTFEESADLRSLARQCQQAISFPYYDLTPPGDLHLTLDRIAFEGDLTPAQLRAIQEAAVHACHAIPPFDAHIGGLGGTGGAVGFGASPPAQLRTLRDALRNATLTVCPGALVKEPEFHPHVAIAYCNADNVPAAEAIAAVEC